MTTKVVSINRPKQKKQFKQMADDLSMILKILDLSTKGLENFQKYSNISEIISFLKTNRAFYEINLNKCNRFINGELEKDEEKNT